MQHIENKTAQLEANTPWGKAITSKLEGNTTWGKVLTIDGAKHYRA